MRICVHEALCKADGFHQRVHALLIFFLGFADLLDNERLADAFKDAFAPVQRRIRILKDDLHLTAQFAQFLLIELSDIRSIQQHFTGSWLMQAEDRAADGGFSAAGFTHEAKRFAFGDAEAHIVHRMQQAGLGIKILLKVFDFQQRFRHCHFLRCAPDGTRHNGQALFQNSQDVPLRTAPLHRGSADGTCILPADPLDPASSR